MNIAEQLKTLLPGVEISEEFVTKLTASIESAVAQRVEEETKEITEKSNAYGKYVYEQAEEYSQQCKDQIAEITEKANAYSEYVVEEMTKKVDDYCEYVIEHFVQEQKGKLVETVEFARMQNVLHAIREAFEANYFTLSDEPANVSLEAKLEESKTAYNTLFEEHRKLKHQIQEIEDAIEKQKRTAVFESLTVKLADTQKERLLKLIEKAHFANLEEYEAGVALMVQEITVVEKTEPVIIPENKTSEPKTVIVETANHDRMKAYLERL